MRSLGGRPRRTRGERGSCVPISELSAAGQSFNFAYCIGDVRHPNASPRCPIPDQIYERMSLVEKGAEPAFPKTSSKQADCLDRRGPLSGREVGFIGFASYGG